MIMWLVAAAAVLVLAPGPDPVGASCRPAGIGVDSFCAVDQVRLNYVDYGGEGPTVILIAGLGSSARIFDDFAPLLRKHHRVLAFTRRGYGASADAPNGDYSNAALVGDILGLMDRLNIGRASFVGHSIAGGELATLGTAHPDRVDRLVYIDAAYDRSSVPAMMAAMPPMQPPSAQARANLTSLTRWREQALGVRSPAIATDLAAVMRKTSTGMIPRTGEKTGQAVLAGDIAAVQKWEKIAAPSLAFYSSKDVAEQLPPDTRAEERKRFIEYSVRILRPWMLRQQAEFLSHRKCGNAVEVPHSTHHLFLERPEWLAKQILAFLASSSPCDIAAAP